MAGLSRLLFSVVLVLWLILLAGCGHTSPTDDLSSLAPPTLAAPVCDSSGTAHVPLPPEANKPRPARSATAVPRPMVVPPDWIPQGTPNRWQWIIIHHSATARGCAASFDRDHRLRGWDELGYHFVIGNGTLSADGEIEVGSRWKKQKWGAHAKTPDNRYNDFGIGICLVGDFEKGRPTAAQMRSLVRLCAYLMHTYGIPPDRVLGHCDTKPTDCPGRNLSIAAVREQARQYIAVTFRTPSSPLHAAPSAQDPGASGE